MEGFCVNAIFAALLVLIGILLSYPLVQVLKQRIAFLRQVLTDIKDDTTYDAQDLRNIAKSGLEKDSESLERG